MAPRACLGIRLYAIVIRALCVHAEVITMTNLARPSYEGCYIHKLRLEVNEGARVEAPALDDPRAASRPSRLAKAIGTAIALLAVLLLIARELSTWVR